MIIKHLILGFVLGLTIGQLVYIFSYKMWKRTIDYKNKLILKLSDNQKDI